MVPWQHAVQTSLIFSVFNGPAFSPCGKIVYFAGSPERIIYSAQIDPRLGRVGERRVFAEIPDALGYPEGMASDDKVATWSAHWDGGCITRYLPDGSVDRRIPMPAQSVGRRTNQVSA
ncbi:SMP-30/gluconolactonase/LRE family protein [Ruegeria hyattellae]|uniref:SMP-30/gluconolactonase/LRE family protein n=1 Tax=Ruegeria hyattellae TaxID=3233337 RepID=UPI00355AF0D4